jgi:hypothetical protein
MSFFTRYPPRYLAKNAAVEKELNVVFDVEGVISEVFSLAKVQKQIDYGDPGLFYGKPGLVYGGVGNDERAKVYILPESNLQVSQIVEPEQGRGSVATMSFALLDKNGESTRFFSQNQVMREPLGRPIVRVRVGYANTRYPEDYFTVFRGYITSIKGTPTKTFIQLSDPNSKRRAQVFYPGKTQVSFALDSSTVTILGVNFRDFFEHTLGPNGQIDPGVGLYLKIDDEFIDYTDGSILDTFTSIVNVTRGARGTTPAAHDAGAEITNMVEITDNCINIALKVMMSGFQGPWKTDVPLLSIINTNSSLGDVQNAVVLPDNIDAVEDYGLTIGDYVYIRQSTQGNNGTYIISGISSVNDRPNNLILFTTNLNAVESGDTGVVMDFRSKYDVLPTACGLSMSPAEIDVRSFELIRDQFLFGSDYNMRFFLAAPVSGKEWLETKLLLPVGCYSVTRLGKVSLNITLPPVGRDTTQVLTNKNVIDPDKISVERAINTRRYFNEIQYKYDLSDDGDYRSQKIVLDATSVSLISISSVLPIDAQGVRTEFDAEALIDRRASYLINRYKNAAIYIELKTNWEVGSIIETGDLVILRDNGTLKIPNYSTGELNIGESFFEVLRCVKDIKSGTVTLGLLSDLSYLVTDRFGTISPSSNVIASDSDAQNLKIEPSFGALFGLSEFQKWTDTVGLNVEIHTTDYSFRETHRLVAARSDNVLALQEPLSISPIDGLVVDVAFYPSDTTDPLDQKLSKLLYAYFTPSIEIVTVSDFDNVEVAASDIGVFSLNQPILAHNENYSRLTEETTVVEIIGNNVIVDPRFIPSPSDGDRLEGIGFLDGGGPYRYI